MPGIKLKSALCKASKCFNPSSLHLVFFSGGYTQLYKCLGIGRLGQPGAAQSSGSMHAGCEILDLTPVFQTISPITNDTLCCD